jgi:hypothetical protein
MSVKKWLAAGLLVGLSISCDKSPVTPNGAVTVTAPAAFAPSNGTLIANIKQPVTLTVTNGFVADGQAASLYEFEVATDAAFTSKVQSPTASPGTSQTSVTLANLAAGQTYYWHVRSTAGGTVGAFSSASAFTVGPAIALSAPTLIAPAQGAQPSGWPTFTVQNVARTGPVGQITYRFDISTSNTFASVVISGTVNESTSGAGGLTNYTPSFATPVPAGSVLFWRATALDAVDGITGPASSTQSFTPTAATAQGLLAAQLGGTLWPGAVPPGTNGHAVLGDSCDGSPNWAITTCFSPPAGVNFQAPTLEALRFFDLFDRGFDPESAIAWMNSNGYPTAAAWYPPPDKAVLGLGFFYLAARNKQLGNGSIWDIVIGLGMPIAH